jgi:hypothetical protein
MATEKQIAANRRNAQKSTGPRSPEGKCRSSRNALRHGLYSPRFIISTEDEAAFHAYSQDLLKHNLPNNPNELELVETMVHAAWRRRRLSSLIQTRLNDAISQVIEQHPDSASDAVRLTALAVNQLEANSASLLRQESHEFRLAATFERSLARLHALRAADAARRAKEEKNRNEAIFAAG